MLPLGWGVWLDAGSLLGLSSAQGAAGRRTSPAGRVMGDVRGSVTHTGFLSICPSAPRADSAVWVQSLWIHLGERVTGYAGGQGLFTVKTYNLLLVFL